jgi:hypothetical protein
MATSWSRHGRPLPERLAGHVALVGSTLVVADLVTDGPGRTFGALSTVAAFGWGAYLGAPLGRGGWAGARGVGRRRPRRRPGPWRRAATWWDGRRSLVAVRSMSQVAEQVAGGDSASFVVLDVARALVELLDLRDCRYARGPGDGTRPALRHGELHLHGARWSAVRTGLPEAGFELPVVARGRVEARFVCLPRHRRPVMEDRVLAASALVDQVASAQLIERAA